MAGLIGADAEQLLLLAKQFESAAGRLDNERRVVASLVGNLVRPGGWAGQDARRFQTDWQSISAPQMARTGDELRRAAERLRANAQAQERASAADGYHSAGAPPFASSADHGALPSSGANDKLLGLFDLLVNGTGKAGFLLELANRLGGAKFLLGKLPVLSSLTAVYELIRTGGQIWQDLTSGDIGKAASAVFHVGWTLAKIHPMIGLADTILGLAKEGASLTIDTLQGPGASQRIFDEYKSGFEDGLENALRTPSAPLILPILSY
ncbi:WXG100 family type VII secretion target [Pseudoclavibacter helvolus]|uniref:WXG100 family type VII secretion target n=1 Tax=Pseudoclavibacter helvolus TaxID=255205 RepID=UPI0024ADA0CA|nr:WXG100 family type VII secretion target [Pseudoclavibacter helvolus]